MHVLNLALLVFVGNSESLCNPLSSSPLLSSPLPLSPLLIPLSHQTGSTYSTTPERREWGKKGYYDGEERKEREREKRRADRVLWERRMRAVKAFGVFIRLPKPRALLPIRLVDTASHVNEMQSRETLTSLCQFEGPFLFSSADVSFYYQFVFLAMWSLSSSVSQSAAFNLWFFLSLWEIMISLFTVRAELCTSLMFSSKDLIHRGFFFSWETPVVIKHRLFFHVCNSEWLQKQTYCLFA